MRLKAFTAPTAEEALRRIQTELGDDALVVATETDGAGVRILVAIESGPELPEAEPARPQLVAVDDDWRPDPAPRFGRGAPPPEADALARVLDFHSLPPMLAARLEDGGRLGRRADPGSVAAALADRLAGGFRFAPLADRRAETPLLLVGPHASGKTLATAKLAAQAALAGISVRIVSTDRESAGGVPALSAFAQILGVPFDVADRPEDLQRFALGKLRGTLLLVDTAAVDPASASGIAALARLAVAVGGEPVLTLPAGLDTNESADIADAFARAGCTRLIATRLDVARRMGGLLAAAAAGTYAFAEASASASPADALEPLDAGRLARILVTAATSRAARNTEAVS
jgi:flagellar biosynthesis protein FlhF